MERTVLPIKELLKAKKRLITYQSCQYQRKDTRTGKELIERRFSSINNVIFFVMVSSKSKLIQTNNVTNFGLSARRKVLRSCGARSREKK